MADEIKRVGIELTAEGAKDFAASMKEVQASTKEAYSELKLAQSQYDKNTSATQKLADRQKYLQSMTEQYTKKQEILRAELKDLESAEERDEAAISKKRAELNQCTAKLNDYKDGLEKANKEIQSHSAQLKEWGEKLETVGGKMKGAGDTLTKGVTAPIVAMGAAAVKTTADFDSQMSKVSAISGATGDDFNKLRDKAREMGAETKFSATEAGEAFEYMAMAGWKTDDMLDGISGIMNLAAASGEDLATTSDIVTDALTAFGMSAEESGHFADVLAAASTNANTNVSMLGESFKYVAPVAGALGYSAEDTSVALGLMANSGIKASSAGTALRTMLTNMAKPTDSMQAAMERLGVSLTDDEGNMHSLREVMDQLRGGFSGLQEMTDEQKETFAALNQDLADGVMTQEDYERDLERLIGTTDDATGATKAQVAAMLAGKTGMSGLLAIVNASEQDYNKLMDAIDGCSEEMDGYNGTAEKMAATMQDNLSGQLTILMSQLQELAISFGDILMPYIRQAVEFIQGLVDKFNSLDEGTKKIITVVGLVAAVVGPLLITLGTLISSIGTIIGAVGALAGAIGAPLLLPIAAVVAAITAAIAIGVLLYKNWDTITAKAGEMAAGIKQKWEDFKSDTAQKFQDIKDGAVRKVEELKTAAIDKARAMKEGAVQKFEELKTAAVDKARALKEGTVQKIQETKDSVTQKIQEMKDSATRKIEELKSGATSKFDAVKQKAKTAFEETKRAIVDPINKAKETVHSAISRIEGLFSRARFKFPSIKTPHFSWDWINIGGIVSVPSIHVNWYKRGYTDPVLFKSPTVLATSSGLKGFGDGPANDAELTYSKNALMADIEEAVSHVVGNGARQIAPVINININVYTQPEQDPEEIAQFVARRMEQEFRRTGAAWA